MRKQLFPRFGTFMQTLPIIITENRNRYFLAVSKTPPQVHFRYRSPRSLTSDVRHPHPPAPPLVSSHSSIGIYACQWIPCSSWIQSPQPTTSPPPLPTTVNSHSLFLHYRRMEDSHYQQSTAEKTKPKQQRISQYKEEH